jgi:hypothetical protein
VFTYDHSLDTDTCRGYDWPARKDVALKLRRSRNGVKLDLELPAKDQPMIQIESIAHMPCQNTYNIVMWCNISTHSCSRAAMTIQRSEGNPRNNVQAANAEQNAT